MMLRSKKLRVMLLISFLCASFMSLSNVSDVFAGKATNVYNYINGVAKYQGLYNCYTRKGKNSMTGKMQFDVKSSVSFDDLKSVSSVLKKQRSFEQAYAKKDTKGCKLIFDSFSKAPATGNSESVQTFANNLGYTKTEGNSSGEKCYGLNFKIKTGDKYGKELFSNKLCPRNGGGYEKIGNSQGKYKVTLSAGDPNKRPFNGKTNNPNYICLSVGVKEGSECTTVDNGKLNKKKLNNLAKNLCGGNVCTGGKAAGVSLQFTSAFAQDSTSGMKVKMAARSTAANSAVSYLSDKKYTDKNSLKIGPLETRLLYQSYLHNYYGVTIRCNKDAKNISDGSINWYKDRKVQKCYYTLPSNSSKKDDKLNGVKDGFLERKTIKGVKDLLNKISGMPTSYSEADMDLAEKIVAGEMGGEDDDGKDAKKDNCLGTGSASGLNWIVCSVLDWVSGAVNSIYNGIIENYLAIDVNLFGDKSPNTRKAWETFRDIANVLFVILFLVVIFSQLTGVGIDNYGIKRILPKLIVIAILINLSFILCELAIDVSNLLGNGFQSMFRGFGEGLKGTAANVGGSSVGIDDAIVGVGVIATVAGIGAVLANPAMLLTLSVSAISVFLSILFLFVLLSVREAAVLVLTVVSPIAIVLYALPNTKSVFDRWLKFFEGMLLVYPIAGLLVGAGDYVARLLVSTGAADDWGIFVAMIVSIAPVFLIPTVLKHSFAAMGSLGSKMAGFGQTISGGASKRMRDSGFYRNVQEAGLERNTRLKAGLDKNGNSSGWRKALGTVISGGNMSRRRNAVQYKSMVDKRGSLKATDQPGFMLDTLTNNEMKRLVASGEIDTTGGMNEDGSGGSGLTGGLYEALKSGDRAKIRAYTDALSAKGDAGRLAVKNAYNAAVTNGVMNTASAKTFADNIMANHAVDYKNNARDMFEVAKGINSAGSDSEIGKRMESTDDLLSESGKKAALAGKFSRDSLGTMDDATFGKVFGGYNDKGDYTGEGVSLPSDLKPEMKEQVIKNAKEALSYSNLKAERRAVLEQIVNSNPDIAAATGSVDSATTPVSSDINGSSNPGQGGTGAAREGETFNVKPVNNSEEYIEHQQYRRPPKNTP